MNTTLVDPYLPKIEIVSKYLIYMAALESKKAAASLISLADWTSAWADIILA